MGEASGPLGPTCSEEQRLPSCVAHSSRHGHATPSPAKGTACLPAPHKVRSRGGTWAAEAPKHPSPPFWKGACQSWAAEGPTKKTARRRQGALLKMDGRGALGSGRRAGGSIPRPPRLGRLKNWGQPLVRPPCPRPASAGCAGVGRIVLAGCSLLGTLNRCCSLGLSVCFCGMGTRISCFRILSQAPRARTGCLRDVLSRWHCLVDLCPSPCTQDTPMRSSNRQLHKEKQTVSTAPGHVLRAPVGRAVQGTGTGQRHPQAGGLLGPRRPLSRPGHGAPLQSHLMTGAHLLVAPWPPCPGLTDLSPLLAELPCVLWPVSSWFPCVLLPATCHDPNSPKCFCLGSFQQQRRQLQPPVLAGSVLPGASDGPRALFCGGDVIGQRLVLGFIRCSIH